MPCVWWVLLPSKLLSLEQREAATRASPSHNLSIPSGERGLLERAEDAFSYVDLNLSAVFDQGEKVRDGVRSGTPIGKANSAYPFWVLTIVFALSWNTPLNTSSTCFI